MSTRTTMGARYDGTSARLSVRDGGLHPPADVIIAWPRPNYINPETRGRGGSILLLIAIVLTIFVFSARMWARLVIGKNAGLDDLLMLISMIPLIGLTVAAYLGKHILG
jgi:hypothetical protein